MFADNERISAGQLRSQMVLALAGVLLLFLPGFGNVHGLTGALACIPAFLLAAVYCFFLVRLAPVYRHPEKVLGSALTRVMGLWHISFFVLTGAFLTGLITRVIGTYLVVGVSPYIIHAVILLTCAMAGIPRIQRRGRMGEVCFPVLLGLLLLLLLLAAGQQDWNYLSKDVKIVPRDLAAGTYQIAAAFTALCALPFLLGQVRGNRCKNMIGAVGILLGVLAFVLVLLQGGFGAAQTIARPWPVIALLAGVRLPGNVLARFDALWIALFLLLLLFSIGSALFYSNYIAKRTGVNLKWYWILLAVYLVSLTDIGGWSVEAYYTDLLFYVYTPTILLIQGAMAILGRRRKV